MKTKHTLLLVLLSTTLLAITPAKANFLDNAKEKLLKAKEISKEKLGQLSETAKEKYQEAKEGLQEKLENVELPGNQRIEVTDSIFHIQENVENDVQFAFIKVTYNNVSEQLEPFPVKNSQINFDLGLMKGSGDYTIQINTTKLGRVGNYTALKTINITNNDSEDRSYLLPSLKVESTNETIINLALEITRDAQNDREKVEHIYKWMSQNIQYNYDRYEKWLRKEPDALYGDDENALNVINTKKTTCNGYTNLFAALTRSLGIKTQIIWGFGQNANHAWNRVLIDDKWENVDTTWGAAYVKSATPLLFLFTEETLFNKDHKNPILQKNK